MALLADLAAYDFGYCSAAQLLARTRNTFQTLSRLERYRGHFFNWYNTRSLAPLHPQYVSTVDSGNLAANLLVLASGLVELSEARELPPPVEITLPSHVQGRDTPVQAHNLDSYDQITEVSHDPD